MQETTTTKPEALPSDLISNAEAARMLDISVLTLNQYRADRTSVAGRMPFYRLGARRNVFYSLADVEQAMQLTNRHAVRVVPMSAASPL